MMLQLSEVERLASRKDAREITAMTCTSTFPMVKGPRAASTYPDTRRATETKKMQLKLASLHDKLRVR